MRKWLEKIAPLVPLVLLIGFAEAAVKLGWVASYLVPAPSQVWEALIGETSDTIWRAALDTGVSALTGFAGSVVIGGLIGIGLSSSRWVERVFSPYAIFFQTVPIIAIAPLLVIWFGYGMPTVISSAFIVSVFPIIAATLTGMRSTDTALVDMFRLYGANRRQRMFKLRLPFAMPSILTGARIAGGLAVIGAIVGEFVAGGGLGGIVDESRTQQRVDRVFAAVLLASGLGLLFFAWINALSHTLLRHWHASERRN